MTNEEKELRIKDILNRGVEDIFVKESLEKQLRSGKKLRVKLGFDPTSSNIHIGRAITLWKLRAFQDLGHQVVFIVGDFTALIGDPSDKLAKRPMLKKEDVEKYLETYKKQIGKIIDLKKAEFHKNSKWLKKLNFAEIAELAECFTVSQMLERRNFRDRFDKKEEISVREFLYPLLQGFDSVMVNADVELGGFDQLFNLKAGRVIQKRYGQKEQDVLTTQMLEGTDGRKMSSSWGNVVKITEEPNVMYGQIMAVRDELIPKYFLLTTRLTENEITEITAGLNSGVNPKDIKMRLAREIVTIYHGEKAAKIAEKVFVDTFSKGNIPEDIEKLKVVEGEFLRDVLVRNKIITSNSDWRRLVSEGAINNIETNEKITDAFYKVTGNLILRIGKKRFVKIEI